MESSELVCVPLGALRYHSGVIRTVMLGSGHPSNLNRVYQSFADLLPKEMQETMPAFTLLSGEWISLGSGSFRYFRTRTLTCIYSWTIRDGIKCGNKYLDRTHENLCNPSKKVRRERCVVLFTDHH